MGGVGTGGWGGGGGVFFFFAVWARVCFVFCFLGLGRVLLFVVWAETRLMPHILAENQTLA